MKRKLIATLLLAVHLTGCYSWRPTTISPAQLIAEEQPDKVRVTLTDETRLTLDRPRIGNDSIWGSKIRGVLFNTILFCSNL